MAWLYTHWAYGAILLVSLSGILTIDWRAKLILWRSRSSQLAGLWTIACLVGFFLVWDIAGILLGIFYTNPRYTVGINLGTPNLPIEEVGFLVLLSYVILVIYRMIEIKLGWSALQRFIRWWKRRE